MHGFFVFLALGLLGGIGAFLVWQDYHLFRRPRIRTTGIVVGHQTSNDDGSTYYCCQIAFTDQFGKRYEFTDSFGRSIPKPDVGSEIAVIYPEGEPHHVRVPRPVSRMLIYLFIFGIAAILIAKQSWLAGG